MSTIRLENYINNAQIQSLNQPTVTATGLPGSAYTDAGFWELERRHYFSPRWMACAHECDLATPGEALPVSIAGYELILTRGDDNVVRAVHNVCAHRAMSVLNEKRSGISTMLCPWHCWTYDLCGRLVATPNLGGIHIGEVAQFDRAELGLREVRCDVFLNMIFVNIDGQAPPLHQFLAPLKARLADYALDQLRPSGQSTCATFEGNWKLVIEGGIEDYHLPWIHPQLGPHRGTFTPEWDETGCYVGFSSQRPIAKETEAIYGSPREVGDGLPVFPHMCASPLQDNLDHPGAIFMVPPSAVFAIMSDHVVTTLLIPTGLDRTEQKRSFLYIGQAATSKEYAMAREAICESWVSVGEQDIDLARTLQRTHRLRHEAGIETRFSPHWEPAVHHFQKMIIDQILAQENK